MCRFLMLFLLLLLSQSAVAQQDTTYYGTNEEEGKMMRQKFLDEYDYVFGTKEITRQLFKINFTSLSPSVGAYSENPVELAFNVDFEKKIKKDISINLSVTPYIGLLNSGLSNDFLKKGIRLGIAPRWYYGMNQKIRNNQRADNLSGAYLSLYVEGNQGNRINSVIKNFTDWVVIGQYGLQSRFMKYGFVDMSIGLGAAYNNKSLELYYDTNKNTFIKIVRDWQPLLSAQVKLGLAFGGGQNQSGGKKCDAFKCFVEENRLLKIDVFNLIKDFSIQRIALRGSASYERRLGRSPFSIQANLNGSWIKDQSISNVPNINGERISAHKYQDWGFGIESRWYYDLRKRIAQGKSANNFSANYITIANDWFSEREYTNTIKGATIVTRNIVKSGVQITPCWGIQRRLFDRGFIDYRIGVGRQYIISENIKDCNTQGICTSNNLDNTWNWRLKSELKIGLAF